MASQPPGTGLTLFNPQGGQLPAHIAAFMDQEGTNIVSRATVPSLSPEGKMWTISIDGQKSKLQRRNQDGDIEPIPIMKAIFLNYNKERGRAYYEGEYDPANAKAPVCWSQNGAEPDASLPGPFPPGTAVAAGTSYKISRTCAECPFSVKGSKITAQGKPTSACGQHRMLALYPDPLMGLPEPLVKPMRLKIAMTTDWDKESPDQEQQGWLSWSRYVEWLIARGCAHTALVVTKMKFDPDAAYPKIFFAAERTLEPQELALVQPMLHSDEVKKLLHETWTPAGVDGIPVGQQNLAAPIQPAAAPAATVAAAQPAAPTQVVVDAQPVVVATAAAAPGPSVSQPDWKIPAGFQMNPAETHTYADYRGGGWTDQQMVDNGKLVQVVQSPAPPPAPAAAPAVVITEEQPVVVSPAQPEAVIVGEQAAPAVTAAQPADTVVVASPAAAEPSPALSAPAGVVIQEAAQPEAVVVAPPTPEPPAAAAVAETVTADVTTEVGVDVDAVLAKWG